jgi:hypothetical protein
MARHPHLTQRSADKRQTAGLDHLPQLRRVLAGTRSSPASSHLSLRANTSPSRDGLPARRRAQPSTQDCALCRKGHTGTRSGDRRRPVARASLRTRGEARGCCAWSHAQRAAVVAPSSIPTPSSPGFYQPSMALPQFPSGMLWCAARLGRAPDGRCRACRVSSRRDGILICARQFRLTNTRHRSRIAMPGPGQPRLPRAKDVSRRSVGDTSAGTNAGARRDPDRGKALVRLSCRGASAFRALQSPRPRVLTPLRGRQTSSSAREAFGGKMVVSIHPATF